MDRATALSRLRTLESELRRRGVGSLFLFGSAARNEAAAGSDLDLFLDPSTEARLSLLDIIGIGHFIEERLATPVDVMTRASLHPLLRSDIEAEAVPVF